MAVENLPGVGSPGMNPSGTDLGFDAASLTALFRLESPKVIAAVARRTGDLGLAEEVAQEAFVAAMEQWPQEGRPTNPGAWLTAVAKRKAIDRLRRDRTFAEKEEAVGYEWSLAQDVETPTFPLESDSFSDPKVSASRERLPLGTGAPRLDTSGRAVPEAAHTGADGVGAAPGENHAVGPVSGARASAGSGWELAEADDELLRLIFTACHPVLAPEARAALTLRLLGGLTTPEIARAFLVSEATLAQRIVRAKRTLGEAKVPFAVPEGEERAERLDSVLEVLYLIFNEGYLATSGDRWLRHELCEEALRQGRVLAALMPKVSEVHGLLALMELQASRHRARLDKQGKPVLLLDQNRAIWDRLQIGRGLEGLARAQAAAAAAGAPLGPYALQAAIAACHARALRPEDTEWVRIAALYEALARTAPSPVVELNRAMALSMAYGPESGLEIMDALVEEGSLADYPSLHAARADLLAKSGRWTEARRGFERAIALTRNEAEREILGQRVEACAVGALWWKPRS